MLKNISNFGKTLSKSEQKSISGGFGRCTPYNCWVKYGGPFLTVEDFACNGPFCEIIAF